MQKIDKILGLNRHCAASVDYQASWLNRKDWEKGNLIMPIAIVLSGGGAKGDFEVGALRFIYDQGARPDILCGTSVGSINAIKLAEGESSADPQQGLAGLEAIWQSLQQESDMYLEEAWLFDQDVDPRVRDVLTGRASDLDVTV